MLASVQKRLVLMLRAHRVHVFVGEMKATGAQGHKRRFAPLVGRAPPTMHCKQRVSLRRSLDEPMRR